MTRTLLTDVSMRAAEPLESGQYFIWDSNLKGFGLRVSQGGSKTWIVRAPHQITIGRFPIISLKDARTEAKRLMAEATLGRLRPRSVPYAEAVETFLNTQKRRPRTMVEYRRLLTKRFRFGGRQLQSIASRDIARVVDDLADTPAEARHAHAAANRFFAWCVERSYLEISPMTSLRAPPVPPSRERVLTLDELAKVAAAARAWPWPFGPIVALCLYTAQRRTEVSLLRWSWINEADRTILLPTSVCKNRREHLFPYGDAVAHILADLPRIGDLLFPSRDDSTRAFSGWAKCKARFDKDCTVADWVLHDLRRTFSTVQGQLRTAPHITERLLNHVTGSLSPIARVYNRYEYLDEMREAALRYEQFIHKIAFATRGEPQLNVARGRQSGAAVSAPPG